jgi:hypothetical protein
LQNQLRPPLPGLGAGQCYPFLAKQVSWRFSECYARQSAQLPASQTAKNERSFGCPIFWAQTKPADAGSASLSERDKTCAAALKHSVK